MLKRHLAYNPEQDRVDKAEEMRRAYEARVNQMAMEGNKVDGEMTAEEDEEISSAATSYFDKTPRLAAQNPVLLKEKRQ